MARTDKTDTTTAETTAVQAHAQTAQVKPGSGGTYETGADGKAVRTGGTDSSKPYRPRQVLTNAEGQPCDKKGRPLTPAPAAQA
ncbi:MAG: hypothetical protein AB7P37_03260 [Ramlibacter sp.]